MRSVSICALLLFLAPTVGCDMIPGLGKEKASKDGATKKASAKSKGDAADESDDGDRKTIRDCPKQLKKSDKGVNRVIGKDCGTIAVSGTYRFDAGTLTIEGGVTLAFDAGASMSVGYYDHAKLRIEGSKDNPVTFTSKGDKEPGAWKSLRLHKKAARSSISGLVLEYAGAKDGGLVVDATEVTVKDSTFRKIATDAVSDAGKGGFAAFEGNSFADLKGAAMRVTATSAAGIGAGNSFPDGAKVFVSGGRIDDKATWKAIGAPFTLLSDVHVSGKDGAQARLTIEPGAVLKHDGNANILVGYYGEAELIAKGNEQKPIVFTSDEKQEPGAWEGLIVHPKGTAEFAHARFEHGGKENAAGVLKLANKARASISHCVFENNQVGLTVHGNDSKLKAFDHNAFGKTPKAMVVGGKELGSLGAANRYADGAVIEVRGGGVQEEQTWHPQDGARMELTGTLRIDSTVEVKPGWTLYVKDAASIDVGYYKSASLRLMGTAEAPIRLLGMRDDDGTWKSLTFHAKAHGNVVNHLQIRNAGDGGGAVFKKGSDGKVDTVTCEKCGGSAVKNDAGGKVELSGVAGS
jgi:hypothetical protein